MEGGPSFFFLRHRHYIEGPVVVFMAVAPSSINIHNPFYM